MEDEPLDKKDIEILRQIMPEIFVTKNLPPDHIPGTGKMGFEEFKKQYGDRCDRRLYTIEDLQAAFEAGNKNK